MLLLNDGRATIDISCLPGPQQQRAAARWDRRVNGHPTDTQTLLPILCGHNHTRLTALFRDYPGQPVPER